MNKMCILLIALLLVSLCLSACTYAAVPDTIDPSQGNSQKATGSNTIPTGQPPSTIAPNNTEHSNQTKPTSSAAIPSPTEDLPMIIQNKLIVNGCSLTEAAYLSFTPNGAMVPFVVVLEKLGAELLWENDHIAEIVYNKKQYTLDTVAATLINKDNQVNCLIPAPGGSIHHQTVDGVFVLDDITMRTVLMIMGTMINIEVDYKNNTVTINV